MRRNFELPHARTGAYKAPSMEVPGATRLVRLGAAAGATIAVLVAAFITHGIVGLVGTPWSGLPMLPDGTIGPVNLIPEQLRPNTVAVRFGDRILAVDGRPAESADAVRR